MSRTTPAEYVINLFGGIRATARAIGRSPSSVCRWAQPKSAGGFGGRIPSLAQQAIVAAARKRRIRIAPERLI